jgi:hypothetical protein
VLRNIGIYRINKLIFYSCAWFFTANVWVNVNQKIYTSRYYFDYQIVKFLGFSFGLLASKLSVKVYLAPTSAGQN